ncbi:MAG: hypothetical protein KC621_07800, partial [Myxococcales bacterium]|nr:hypothetical protein [Myxococcales bacterium]
DAEGAARTLDAWHPLLPADRLSHARSAALLERHERAVAEALEVADHPGIGPEALAFALEETRRTCDRGPVDRWVTDHPMASGWPGYRDVLAAIAADDGCGDRGGR